MSQTPEYAPAFVSVVNEFPEDLYDAMRSFVRTHPHWDQYRLMQVAVAGFLFQQGSRERAVARHYLDGLFDRGASGQQAEAPDAPVAPVPAVRRLESAPAVQDAPAPLRPHPNGPATAARPTPLRPAAQAIPHPSAPAPLTRLAS